MTDLQKVGLEQKELKKMIDVAILAFHGAFGEDGTIQAILEAVDIPYQSSDQTSMAVTFDKIISRQIMQAEQIPQPDYFWFTDVQWQAKKDDILKKVTYPAFTKVARSGSSIGVIRVSNEKEFKDAVAALFKYGHRLLVEKEVGDDFIEVNVSVLGYASDLKTTTPEQPLKSEKFLSFADKYERGAKGGKNKMGMAGSSHRIPAPLSPVLTEKVRSLAKHIAEVFDCSGVIRIDFFANPSTEEILVIEINAIPGSMGFYLWEYEKLPYRQLIDKLVAIALAKHQKAKSYISSFSSSVLS